MKSTSIIGVSLILIGLIVNIMILNEQVKTLEKSMTSVANVLEMQNNINNALVDEVVRLQRSRK